MNSIIYDHEIIIPENNKYKYYYDFTESLDKRDCIKFALFCAKIFNLNTKESKYCIDVVEKWLKDENAVTPSELYAAADIACVASYAPSFFDDDISNAVYSASNAAYAAAAYYSIYYAAAAYSTNAVVCCINAAGYSIDTNINIINKYLQILLRKTKQFGNNKILEQISKIDVDKLELVDWSMITDIIQEEYNIVHEFDYWDIFSRRCLIELLRREYV